ncbi:MAG: hypothetical protein DRP54_07300 [Spirochaetes bacterium]|nr:MAG: hypothetical protein DRP54_07300 [Spirochaetota bacterium]
MNIGALDHIVIRDANGGGGNEVTTHTMTADQTFTVYAAGYDSEGNYISDVNVTWDVTGTLDNTGFPKSGVSSITFDPNSTGMGTITADAGGGITDTTETITVTAGAIASFSITAPANVTAGVPFTVTVTNAQDAGGNLTNGTVTVSWLSSNDGTANSPNGASPSFTQITVTDGSGSALQTLVRADTNVILQGDAGGGVTAQTGAITVSHGELGYFDISENTTTPVLSTPVTLTITAYDKYGNRWNNSIPVNDITLTATGADDVTANLIWAGTDLIDNADLTGTLRGSANGGTWQFDANGQYTVTLGYEKAFDAVIPEVLATENGGQQSGNGNPITWQPAAATQFAFIGTIPDPLEAGQNIYVRVEARDSFGNVDTSYNSTATFSDIGPDNIKFLTSQNNYTDATAQFNNGVWEGYIKTDTSIVNNINKAGNQSQLLLSDGSISSPTNTFTVTSGPLHHLGFTTVLTGYIRANDPIPVIIDAYDQYNNYVDYSGTATIRDATGTIYEDPNQGDTSINFVSTVVNGYRVGRYTGNFIITQSYLDNVIVVTTDSGATGSSGLFNVLSDEIITELVQDLSPRISLAGSTVDMIEIKFTNVDPSEDIRLDELKFYLQSGRDSNYYPVVPSTLINAVYVEDLTNGGTYENTSLGTLTDEIPVSLGSGIIVPKNGGSVTFRISVRINEDISGAVENNMQLRLADVIGVFTVSLIPVEPVTPSFESVKSAGNFIQSALVQIRSASRLAAFNYPNPFNPRTQTTKITFFNPLDSSTITIKIFTITGKLVRDLSLKTPQSSGSIEVEWDGRNGRGQIVRNGIYVAIIKLSDGTKMTVKIAVVK